MSWTKLGTRLGSIPLVLSGPLVRRVDSTSTTVWIALREPRKVTLRVYRTEANSTQRVEVQKGTRSTARLGQHLHIVAVTAKGILDWGRLYVYDLRFGVAGNDAEHVPEGGTGLFDADVLASTATDARKMLLYEANELGLGMVALDLPSFATPPPNLNKVRLIHASCRKPHGYSKDALQILDSLIGRSLSDPLRRPHQLFLTGDQIYADDVADGLLAMLTDAGDTLLGWTETLPTGSGPLKAAQLLPGRRQEIVNNNDRPFPSEHAKSHLISLGEFYAMYLFAWSAILWPIKPPDFADVYPQEWQENQIDASEGKDQDDCRHHQKITEYEAELSRLGNYKVALPMVRRALANIPSYMIFDDHEITDDWYFDRQWCEKALAAPLGRRVIGNGLLSYAVFQAWGNTPDQFVSSEPGNELLEAVSQWDGTEAHLMLSRIQLLVGLNKPEDVRRNKKLTHPAGALDWHYHLPAVDGGPPYEVIVLDSRTWRGYPHGPKDAAALISDETVLDAQLVSGVPSAINGVTIVIAPGPVIGVPLVEELVQTVLPKMWPRKYNAPRAVDREAWSHHRGTFELLLGRLVQRSQRVVFLSGDVHYGFSAHLSYWARRPFGSSLPEVSVLHRAVMAQLTASSLKNESKWPPTYLLHDYGFGLGGLPLPRNISGWHETPTVYKVGMLGNIWNIKPRSKPPIFETGSLDLVREAVSNQPDWRYRVDFLLAEPRIATPANIPLPPNWDMKEAATKTYLDSQEEYRKYMAESAPGREIVGWNNLGEVTFTWNEGDDRSVTHQLWWWLAPTAQPFPLSKYIISLRLNDPRYPEPAPLPVQN